MKVKLNHHTKGCSLNIMTTISVKQQNSQADILTKDGKGCSLNIMTTISVKQNSQADTLNPFYSGQIALI